MVESLTNLKTLHVIDMCIIILSFENFPFLLVLVLYSFLLSEEYKLFSSKSITYCPIFISNSSLFPSWYYINANNVVFHFFPTFSVGAFHFFSFLFHYSCYYSICVWFSLWLCIKYTWPHVSYSFKLIIICLSLLETK